jgi:enamine deaminase RidA (YjgF/YER057c/UK114 family)
MSKIVKHGGTVYISGQTAADAGDSIVSQTEAVLQNTDELLQSAGTSRSHLLTASIWLKDIERDFKAFNAVWNAWVDPAEKPVRATVQSPMARDSILVEIQVTAAEPTDAAIKYLREVAGAPPPGAFSRAVKHNGMVYVSGVGADASDVGGAAASRTAFEESRSALENVSTILRAAGSAPERIVQATMLLTDRSDYDECNRAYVEWFQQQGVQLPARSTGLWGVPTEAKVAFSVVASDEQ